MRGWHSNPSPPTKAATPKTSGLKHSTSPGGPVCSLQPVSRTVLLQHMDMQLHTQPYVKSCTCAHGCTHSVTRKHTTVHTDTALHVDTQLQRPTSFIYGQRNTQLSTWTHPHTHTHIAVYGQAPRVTVADSQVLSPVIQLQSDAEHSSMCSHTTIHTKTATPRTTVT